MIEVKNIKKAFGDTQILKGISAAFEEGKTSLIIGSSGAGKSVFLKCLVGLHEVDEGEIWYGDFKFSHVSGKKKKNIRQKIGMLFQGSALFDSMTVEENIMFPLKMFTKMTKKERLHRVNEVLERVNLKGVNKLFTDEISGGMQKRVGIARAIVLTPEYLFCDEPNSGLDPQTSIVINDLLTDITKDYNITTVINTHDMNAVMDMGEHIIYLHDGKKAWEGVSKDILTTDNQLLLDFIFASEFLKEVRDVQLKKNL